MNSYGVALSSLGADVVLFVDDPGELVSLLLADFWAVALLLALVSDACVLGF